MLALDQALLLLFCNSILQLAEENQLDSDFPLTSLTEKFSIQALPSIEKPLFNIINTLSTHLEGKPIAILAAKNIDFSQAGVIGHLMQSSTNILEANQLAAKYLSENNSFLKVEMIAQEHNIICAYQLKKETPIQNPTLKKEMLLFAMVVAYQGNCKLAGCTIQLTALNFSFPATKAIETYQQYFGILPNFNQAEAEICFHKKWLYKSIISQNQELFQLLNDYLSKHYQQNKSFKARIKQQIIERFKKLEEISIQTIAQHQNLSIRSLQRHLQEENTNFRTLYEESREELAKELIKDLKLSIQEIAIFLDYSSTAAFSKAFKSWQSKSPLQYRKEFKIL